MNLKDLDSSIITRILEAHRHSVYVPIAFRVNGAPNVELAALLVRKGFHVEGATPNKTAFLFIHGPLAHAVPKSLDQRVLLAANMFAGVKIMELSHEHLFNVLSDMNDREREPLPEEAYRMLAMYDKIENLEVLHKVITGKDMPEPELKDRMNICGVAHLPNGDEVHMHIDREHADEFVRSGKDGDAYMDTGLLRLLLGFFLSNLEGGTKIRRIDLADFTREDDDATTEVKPTTH
jgi:hypothetical protein